MHYILNLYLLKQRDLKTIEIFKYKMNKVIHSGDGEKEKYDRYFKNIHIGKPFNITHLPLEKTKFCVEMTNNSPNYPAANWMTIKTDFNTREDAEQWLEMARKDRKIFEDVFEQMGYQRNLEPRSLRITQFELMTNQEAFDKKHFGSSTICMGVK